MTVNTYVLCTKSRIKGYTETRVEPDGYTKTHFSYFLKNRISASKNSRCPQPQICCTAIFGRTTKDKNSFLSFYIHIIERRKLKRVGCWKVENQRFSSFSSFQPFQAFIVSSIGGSRGESPCKFHLRSIMV